MHIHLVKDYFMWTPYMLLAIMENGIMLANGSRMSNELVQQNSVPQLVKCIKIF